MSDAKDEKRFQHVAELFRREVQRFGLLPVEVLNAEDTDTGALTTKVGSTFSFARHFAYPVSRRPPAPLDKPSSIQIFI
jgi:hypothetical protein